MSNHMISLETERLLLRPFLPEDAKDLFAYLHEPSVHCFMDMKLNTLEEAQKAALERSQDDTGLYFAIVLKETQQVIGEIFSHAEGTDPTESVLDTFSPCWMLHNDFKGKGYMYEAAHAYFDFLFHQKGARRIYIYTEDYNIACQKLSEKLGMRQEGLFKEFVSFINGSDGEPLYENTYQYAILKKEWDEHKILSPVPFHSPL